MKRWTPALALALCFVAAPKAGATVCPFFECDFADVWTRLVPVNAALIPVDGVLLLQGDNYAYDDIFDWAAQISLEVTLSGQPALCLQAPDSSRLRARAVAHAGERRRVAAARREHRIVDDRQRHAGGKRVRPRRRAGVGGLPVRTSSSTVGSPTSPRALT